MDTPNHFNFLFISASPSWKRACGTGVPARRASKARENDRPQTLVVKMLLEQIGPELWLAEGEPVSFHGFAYPTRSVVARLPDGGVWVWSPIELKQELQTSIDQLGTVLH